MQVSMRLSDALDWSLQNEQRGQFSASAHAQLITLHRHAAQGRLLARSVATISHTATDVLPGFRPRPWRAGRNRPRERNTQDRATAVGFASRVQRPAPLWVRALQRDTAKRIAAFSARLEAASESATDDGHTLHVSVKPWLQERVRNRSGLLYGWSARTLKIVELERFNPDRGSARSRASRHRATRSMRAAPSGWRANHWCRRWRGSGTRRIQNRASETSESSTTCRIGNLRRPLRVRAN